MDKVKDKNLYRELILNDILVMEVITQYWINISSFTLDECEAFSDSLLRNIIHEMPDNITTVTEPIDFLASVLNDAGLICDTVTFPWYKLMVIEILPVDSLDLSEELKMKYNDKPYIPVITIKDTNKNNSRVLYPAGNIYV